MLICVWPDYTWCYEDERHEYHCFSDDFMWLEVPPEVEEIDAWLEETKPQG